MRARAPLDRLISPDVCESPPFLIRYRRHTRELGAIRLNRFRDSFRLYHLRIKRDATLPASMRSRIFITGVLHVGKTLRI